MPQPIITPSMRLSSRKVGENDMKPQILILLMVIVAFLPLKTTEALSFANLVTEQHLTIQMAPDDSAKIEDRLHYVGQRTLN